MILCLAGDSGYALRRWLLTPVLNAHSTEELRYSDVHAHAWSVVEQAIGLLKGRMDASGVGAFIPACQSVPHC